ncbi:MAG: N-acetylmuramoyl-L-alanine amidase [Alphaproteobacteria bacterium]|jgi:N-acetylmuramoyl-L-alanine amidase|tara:strand:- start:47385 stop:48128 length:744 start_codon:yes stop_codon:yes gene_type:complete
MFINRFTSPNYNQRENSKIDMLVLHYTAMAGSCEDVCKWLCNETSHVSSHYVVDRDGTIFSLIDDNHRAWHAGVSFWDGSSDINSRSIGIEIHNLGEGDCFPEKQISSLCRLIKNLMDKHGISRHNVLGHSDVAPERKKDPGNSFPWIDLHEQGIGIWSNKKITNNKSMVNIGEKSQKIEEVQNHLKSMGYNINVNSIYDNATRIIIEAFQRHWRPKKTDGFLDLETEVLLKDVFSQFKYMKKLDLD